jgi:hypothetical protein
LVVWFLADRQADEQQQAILLELAAMYHRMACSPFQHLSIVFVLVAAPIIVVFAGLFLLDRTISVVHGPRAGGHVTSI